MSDYGEFLRRKRREAADHGIAIDPETLHPNLFAFQQHITAWALRKGRAAIFADTGLGKTRMQLEWARHISDRTLIIAPLSVARQTVREAGALGLSVRYVRHPDEIEGPGVYTTNYEMVEHFDPDLFGGVVLDECFAAGTMIDTPNGPKRIEDFSIGDVVNSAAGSDEIWDIHRREVPYAIEVRFGQERVVCSPNHPWFTQRGWVGAQDLEPGDALVSTAEAVRMVRRNVRQVAKTGARNLSILQHVLLSEMAYERSRASGEAAHAGGCCEARPAKTRVVIVGVAAGAGRTGAHSDSEPNERSGGSSQGLPPIERDAPRTFRAWGQWDRSDGRSGEVAGCTWRGVGAGVVHLTGSTDSRLSNALQARLGERRAASRYRTGWFLSLLSQGARPEEGREAAFARVDGIEILEPGHPRLAGLRDAAGKLYFYDLGVTGHPSYSVAGRLVHNSSILKNHTGTTRTRLIEQWADTPYRLCCTATPAPNDVAELANHVEFLGLMSRTEFLASYFVHDDDGWRLKGHATASMFDWMTTWATAVRRPSDLGYPDTGYELPPLRIVTETVDVDIESEGQLFATDLGGVGGRHAVRRSTLEARVARTVELVKGSEGQWIVWCGLNPEADAIAAALPDARNVEGSMHPDIKAGALEAFQDGRYRVLVSKPSICGMGMNFQNAHRMAFVGVNDSWESYYQAIRRCYRFGQTESVDVHVVVSELETQIVDNLRRKETEAAALVDQLVSKMTKERVSA